MSNDAPIGPGRPKDLAKREAILEAAKTLFLSLGQAREIIAAWVDDYNTERPHSSLGYATPAAFAAGLEKQRPARVQAVASHAPMRNHNRRSLVAAG